MVGPQEVKGDVRFVAHHPAVMAWWRVRDFARARFDLGAIIHTHVDTARDDVGRVG